MYEEDMLNVILDRIELLTKRSLQLEDENTRLHQEVGFLKIAKKNNTTAISADVVRELLESVYDVNNKIRQIKIVRELTGWGLKESKELVEEVRRAYGQE